MSEAQSNLIFKLSIYHSPYVANKNNGIKEKYLYIAYLKINLLTLKARSKVRCDTVFKIFVLHFLYVDNNHHTCKNISQV